MNKKLLIIALIIGLFMRGFQFKERFLYAHDNDLASWIIKDVVVDKHFRLVGQLTSAPGIFIGPLYYYSLIPFYFLTNMDPIGSVFFSIAVGLLAIFSAWYVFSKLYGSLPGSIIALLYAGSAGISASEREVVPTTPVMLWSIWFFYCVNLIFQGKKSGLILAAILFALVWHLNLALILLAPLVLVSIIVKRKSFVLRDFFLPIVIFIIMLLPLVVFEVNHGFIQTKSLVSSLTSTAADSTNKIQKATRVLYLMSKNVNSVFGDINQDTIPLYLLPSLLFLSLLYLHFKRKIPQHTLLIVLLWLGLYIVFFSVHPIIVSEYYLNGANIVWISLASLFLSNFPKKIIFITLAIFVTYNLHVFLTSNVNRSGYQEKKNLVAYIKQDALSNDYPCIAISYMTDPGYNFGYRYFFWLAGLHVNQPNSNSPVYTIVFPHSRAGRLDQTFGALGVVLPDYQRYTPQQVKLSCSGQNSNLTDPMFGFTK